MALIFKLLKILYIKLIVSQKILILVMTEKTVVQRHINKLIKNR
jgi:hypothetical protein